MNHQFPNDPGRGFVVRAEQLAQDFRRIVAAVVVIADGVNVLHEVVSPLIAAQRRP